MNLIKFKTLIFTAAILLSSAAHAHLVTFGWKDNGNGSVTLWGEHWHGDHSAPYSDNGGISIYDNNLNFLYKAQWTGAVNNSNRDTMLANNQLTGFQGGFHGDNSYYNDWFFTDPLVIGNGTYNFFTGTNCCVDTMDDVISVTLKGITSVPGGTGPGAVKVPESSSLMLLALGLFGLVFMRRRKA